MGDRVLVTGASGFVGSAVARALAARGDDVSVLMRESSPRTNIAGIDCRVVMGDMRDSASMLEGDARRALPFPCRGRLPALGARSRRNRPQQSGRCARRDGSGAHCRRRAHRLHHQRRHTEARSAGGAVDETSRHTEETAIGAYKRSKVVAERLGRADGRGEGLPAVIVSPSTPIGPRDIKPTPTGPHHRRGGLRPDAGLCRYRPQSRACRRRGARAICCALEKATHRRELYSRRRRVRLAGHARRHRAAGRPQAAARAIAARPALSARLCARKPSRASPARSRS